MRLEADKRLREDGAEQKGGRAEMEQSLRDEVERRVRDELEQKVREGSEQRREEVETRWREGGGGSSSNMSGAISPGMGCTSYRLQ